MKDTYWEWHENLVKEVRQRKQEQRSSSLGRNSWDDEGVNQRYTRELQSDNHYSPNPFD